MISTSFVATTQCVVRQGNWLPSKTQTIVGTDSSSAAAVNDSMNMHLLPNFAICTYDTPFKPRQILNTLNAPYPLRRVVASSEINCNHLLQDVVIGWSIEAWKAKTRLKTHLWRGGRVAVLSATIAWTISGWSVPGQLLMWTDFDWYLYRITVTVTLRQGESCWNLIRWWLRRHCGHPHVDHPLTFSLCLYFIIGRHVPHCLSGSLQCLSVSLDKVKKSSCRGWGRAWVCHEKTAAGPCHVCGSGAGLTKPDPCRALVHVTISIKYV